MFKLNAASLWSSWEREEKKGEEKRTDFASPLEGESVGGRGERRGSPTGRVLVAGGLALQRAGRKEGGSRAD